MILFSLTVISRLDCTIESCRQLQNAVPKSLSEWSTKILLRSGSYAGCFSRQPGLRAIVRLPVNFRIPLSSGSHYLHFCIWIPFLRFLNTSITFQNSGETLGFGSSKFLPFPLYGQVFKVIFFSYEYLYFGMEISGWLFKIVGLNSSAITFSPWTWFFSFISAPWLLEIKHPFKASIEASWFFIHFLKRTFILSPPATVFIIAIVAIVTKWHSHLISRRLHCFCTLSYATTSDYYTNHDVTTCQRLSVSHFPKQKGSLWVPQIWELPNPRSYFKDVSWDHFCQLPNHLRSWQETEGTLRWPN